MATSLLAKTLQKKIQLTTPVVGQSITFDGTKFVNSSGHVSFYRSGLDDGGVYTIVEEKRKNGTLSKRAVLSGGTSPEYTTRTETWFGLDGTTVVLTQVFTINYTDGQVVSEVMQ